MDPDAAEAEAAQEGVMRRFAQFACIDWSGARTRWQKGIAVAACDAGGAAPRLAVPQGRRWSRVLALDWLLACAEARADLLIGVDFSTALPFDPARGYLAGVPECPRDAIGLWHHVDTICVGDAHLAATSFVADARIAPHFRIGAATGALFHGEDSNGRLRTVERTGGIGNPASCFNLVGPRQVGLSSLTGMRVLNRLRGRIPVWPFDAVPAAGPLIVEVYPSIAARAGGRAGHATKMVDHRAMNAVLTDPAIGSAPVPGEGPIDDHSSDALVTAAWLRRAAADPALWSPQGLTPAVRATEGWTFGVP